MRILVILFIVFIILNLIIRKKEYHKVKSTVDNKFYIVRKNKKTEQKNADKLAKVNIKINQLINSLSNSKHKQILKETKLRLRESSTNEVGYTLNKEEIGLCIEDNDNALFFITVHELAHVITPEYGHTEKFWKNFEILLKQAIKIGLYQYKDYNNNPTTYCNEKISYTPIKK